MKIIFYCKKHGHMYKGKMIDNNVVDASSLVALKKHKNPETGKMCCPVCSVNLKMKVKLAE